jgi:DNA polymerase III delta prime subunit
MKDDIKTYVWSDKYAPQNLRECVLTEEIYSSIQFVVDSGMTPNIILTGKPGVGKTTVANFIVKALEADFLFINASMNGNIDTLRNDIKSFASSKSFNNKRKYVILDEADHLNKNSTQPALRSFIQTHINNCGFIFTCNNINGIIAPLQSRAVVINFDIPKEEYSTMALMFFKKCVSILENEKIQYDKNQIKLLMKKFFPDFRRILTELQFHSSSGKLNISSTLLDKDEFIVELLEFLKLRDFSKLRNFVAQNMDSSCELFDILYEKLYEKVTTNSIPDLILILAKYQYQAAFVSSQEINMAACVTELMGLDYV